MKPIKAFFSNVMQEKPSDARKVFDRIVSPKVMDHIDQIKTDIWMKMAKQEPGK